MYRVVMSLVAALCVSACSVASMESDAAVPAPVADVSTVTGTVSSADPHTMGIKPKNCMSCHYAAPPKDLASRMTLPIDG